MERKTIIAITGLSAVILIILIALGVIITKKLTPSNEVMLLTDYYKLEDSEVMIILQNEIYDSKGLLIDGEVYIDYDTVVGEFNHRFYWDHNENVLTYTTPNEIIRAEAGSNEYSITKSMIQSKAKKDFPIAEVFADKVFVAMDFVEEYSDVRSRFYPEPNRIIIEYKWGDYLYADVKKETQLRKEPNIKSPVLIQLSEESSLMLVDIEEAPKKGFIKVMTEEGVIGYVKEKYTAEPDYKTLSSSYSEPVYTQQERPWTINMVFHQVFNSNSAQTFDELIKSTKGVNVVSPTWFSVIDNTGAISSFASHDYVDKAKQLGIEVWALVDDFNTEISMMEVLSRTSTRDNLSNALIQAALEYQLNGINIDFEKITSESGMHYIQFLRELSVKCRNNGIVLSVDNYVPAPYNEFYDREEQGKIVDYLIVMAYDEYYAGSEVSGPVSSIGFVRDAIRNTLESVPKERTIIAIPFYTRLWKETQEGDVSSESFGMTKAAAILMENKAEPEWDDSYGSYYAEYEVDGITYRMWQEEEKSIEEKLKVIYEADVAGIAAWKLGLEKEEIWNVITRYIN